MPKNARAAQHDSSHMNKEQEMNYNMNAQRMIDRADPYDQNQQAKREHGKNRAGPGRNSEGSGPPQGARNYKPNRTHQTYQSNNLDITGSKGQGTNPPSGLDNYLKTHTTTPVAAQGGHKNMTMADAQM